MTDDKIDMENVAGTISIHRDHFLLVHDYFAAVLNAALELSQKSRGLGESLSREECAGRILMVSMMEMEKFAQENPDTIEEMIVSRKMMEEKGNSANAWSDAMYR